jgi:tRNA(Ile2) C34 agmatinyltransferase TiaS
MTNNSKPPEVVSIKQRKCLLCQRVFESKGVGNRICRRCKDTTDYRDIAFAETYRRF